MFPPRAPFFAVVARRPHQASRRAKPGSGGGSHRGPTVSHGTSRFARVALFAAAAYLVIAADASARTISPPSAAMCRD